MLEKEAIIEGLLFASGCKVSIEKISEIVNMGKEELKDFMKNMIYKYNNSPRGIIIREINESYQLSTRPEIYEDIKPLFEKNERTSLSVATLETLSIIAYNSPITRAKIEGIRGINSDNSISKLLENNLIMEAGRLDAPGRPILFKTTDAFLRVFGIKSIKELPPLEMVDVGSANGDTDDNAINDNYDTITHDNYDNTINANL